MILLDTNIFIYLANGTLNPAIIANTDISHATITKIETLGLSSIQANELILLGELFNESYGIDLTDDVVECAVKLRQAKQMSLGDSIIAASALENGLTLWTANTDDFMHVDKLSIFNPLN